MEEQKRKNNSEFKKTERRVIEKEEIDGDKGVEEFEITRELLYETYNREGRSSELPTDITMNVGKLINYMLDNYYDLSFSQRAHM